MARHKASKRHKTRSQTTRKTGLLSGSGRSAEEIAAEDRALRAGFSWLDIPLEEDEPQDKPPLTLSNPLPQSQNAAPQGKAPAIEEAPDLWQNLPTMPVQPAALNQNLVITASRRNPVHAAFDVLRARLLAALSDHGWKRVAITSPTRDCGKTFVSVNLAITLSRYENCRTILMDMDMRNPSVAKTLGLSNVGAIGNFLRGEAPVDHHFFKFGRNDLNIGDNLAIAMNDTIEPYASELMQEKATRTRLRQMEQDLQPQVILFDLPPALANDDVIAFEENFDGVLIVIDGTRTSGQQVREVMRRLGDQVPLLGVILNKAEDAKGDEYGY